MSYADITKTNIVNNINSSNDEIDKYINTQTNSDLKHNGCEQLNSNLNYVDLTVDQLVSNLNLSTFERNNGYFPITLLFNKKSQEDLESLRKEIMNYSIAPNNIFLDNKTKHRSKIHLLIQSENTIINLIRDRNKFGFITTSREYHVLTGTVNKHLPAEQIKKIVQCSSKNNLNFAHYHTHSTDKLHHVFGLIEYKRDDNIKSINLIGRWSRFTIRQASQSFSRKKQPKDKSEESDQSDENQNVNPETKITSEIDNNKMNTTKATKEKRKLTESMAKTNEDVQPPKKQHNKDDPPATTEESTKSTQTTSKSNKTTNTATTTTTPPTDSDQIPENSINDFNKKSTNKLSSSTQSTDMTVADLASTPHKSATTTPTTPRFNVYSKTIANGTKPTTRANSNKLKTK